MTRHLVTLLVGICTASCSGSAPAQQQAAAPAAPSGSAPASAAVDPGIVTMASALSFDETVRQLEANITGKGLRIFVRVDHHKNAEGAGLELLPTAVIIFGNPKVGTLLMQTSRSAAIDLPQKLLVWQDTSGQVSVSYNDPAYLNQRHGLSERQPVLGKIAGLLQGLASSVGRGN